MTYAAAATWGFVMDRNVDYPRLLLHGGALFGWAMFVFIAIRMFGVT